MVALSLRPSSPIAAWLPVGEVRLSSHAVCEFHTISVPSFVAPAKNDTLSIQVQGSHIVKTQPLIHIDEAPHTTTPSWLTNDTHTSQAEPFSLRPKEARDMLPNITNINKVVSFSFSKDDPTGAAVDGLHPHKGDSASAINATMEYTSEPLTECGYEDAVINFYNELACYFAFVANEHNNNFGKPRKPRRTVRKKKKKVRPLRAHLFDRSSPRKVTDARDYAAITPPVLRNQNSPRVLTRTIESARSRMHARAAKSEGISDVLPRGYSPRAEFALSGPKRRVDVCENLIS